MEIIRDINNDSRETKLICRHHTSWSLKKSCNSKFMFHIDFDEHRFFVSPSLLGINEHHINHTPIKIDSSSITECHCLTTELGMCMVQGKAGPKLIPNILL